MLWKSVISNGAFRSKGAIGCGKKEGCCGKAPLPVESMGKNREFFCLGALILRENPLTYGRDWVCS